MTRLSGLSPFRQIQPLILDENAQRLPLNNSACAYSHVAIDHALVLLASSLVQFFALLRIISYIFFILE